MSNPLKIQTGKLQRVLYKILEIYRKLLFSCQIYRTSHIQYNDENALSYTIDLAYYAARDDYRVIRELPTGNGFANLAFIPKGNKPALLVELKWNKKAETAIAQIKEKKYPAVLEKYKNDLLLVGITYDKKTRKHTCKIERN